MMVSVRACCGNHDLFRSAVVSCAEDEGLAGYLSIQEVSKSRALFTPYVMNPDPETLHLNP